MPSFNSRLLHMQENLRQTDPAGGYFLEAPIDLYYFTGIQMSLGRLLITPRDVILFVDGRYQTVAKQTFKTVKPLTNAALLEAFKKFSEMNTLYFDDSLAFSTWKELKNLCKQENIDLIERNRITAPMRMIKSKEEIAMLEKSARVLQKGLEQIQTLLKPGITEKQIALEFEVFVKKHGADSLAFPPIIAFGTNSAMPHHISGDAPLQPNDVVLIDIGVVVDHYASDMTRTFFYGTPKQEMEEGYAVVKNSWAKAIELCTPNTPIQSIDAAAREIMGKWAKYFIHSLGHGIGLEVHESPLIRGDTNQILKTGMVITIEPGIYLPGVGGIRYEDMILITEDKPHNFFANISTNHLVRI